MGFEGQARHSGCNWLFCRWFPTFWQRLTTVSGSFSKLTEPLRRSSEPRSKLSEPRSKLAEPRSKLTEPRSKLTEPRSKLTEPRSKLAEPRSKLTEPRSKLTEPRSKLTEPRSKLTEPFSELAGRRRKPSEPLPTCRERWKICWERHGECRESRAGGRDWPGQPTSPVARLRGSSAGCAALPQSSADCPGTSARCARCIPIPRSPRARWCIAPRRPHPSAAGRCPGWR